MQGRGAPSEARGPLHPSQPPLDYVVILRRGLWATHALKLFGCNTPRQDEPIHARYRVTLAKNERRWPFQGVIHLHAVAI